MTAVRILVPATIAALCLCPPAAIAQDTLTAEKREDIERLLDMTQALALGQQMSAAVTAQMGEMIRHANPSVPPRVITALSEVVETVIAEHLPEFQDMIVLVYDRHLSHDDIKGLIAFYSTEVGQKTIRLMPQILQESMLRGQAWGESLGPEIERRVLERLRREGFGL